MNVDLTEQEYKLLGCLVRDKRSCYGSLKTQWSPDIISYIRNLNGLVEKFELKNLKDKK